MPKRPKRKIHRIVKNYNPVTPCKKTKINCENPNLEKPHFNMSNSEIQVLNTPVKSKNDKKEYK